MCSSMSKQSDWRTLRDNPHSTESILNESRVVAVSSGHIGGVVAAHHIKTAAMWYHDFTDQRWIT